jgi:hypothetical protein
MNRLIKSTLLAGVSAILLTGSVNMMAQQQQPGNRPNRGNFDPAQMMERMKESMGVTSDDEWKVISERLTKVMELRRDSMMGGFGRMGGRRGGDQAGGGQGGGPAVNPTVEALQKAIDAKDAKEIKAKLAVLREERAKKTVEIKAAQEELKKVLTPGQEAYLVLRGMLE